MLGIVVALEREARVVRGALHATGLVHGARLAVSGIGPHRARQAALALVGEGATSLVVIGLAGALIDAIAAGDLLLPSRVCSDDGAVIGGGAPHAAALIERLGHVAPVHTGLLTSVSKPAGNRAAKRALALASGAVAVDMESAAVAGVASAAGLPWTVLRAVSDAVARTLPHCALQAVDNVGQVRPAVLAAGLLRRPWEIGALISLGRDVRTAQQVLALASAAVLPVLCTSGANPARA